MPACTNGRRFVSKNGQERDWFSDSNASWGHRSAVSTRKGGGFYGFKLMAVCTATDLPLAWNVRTARDHEAIHALPLIDAARARRFAVETAALDKGYDVGSIYDGCEARDVRPSQPSPKPTVRSRLRRAVPGVLASIARASHSKPRLEPHCRRSTLSNVTKCRQAGQPNAHIPR
jgi:hypothetical protein